jgi:hypothetical protein
MGGMKAFACLALCLVSALAPARVLAEAGYATRDVELRAEPAGAAKLLGTLQKGARFEITAEKGAWSRIASASVNGWTLSFYVMKGEPAAQVSLGTRLGEVWTLGTERRAETTATIGVRGLDEEQLKAAQFNAEELQRLEALSQSAAEAEVFARRGKLAPQAVNYLAPPPAAGMGQPQ